jgi:hypothetical protein
MHLDTSTLDAYLTRSLDSARLHSLDAHVASCLACLLAVEAVALDAQRWERRGMLGRLARVTPREPAAAEPLLAEAA